MAEREPAIVVRTADVRDAGQLAAIRARMLAGDPGGDAFIHHLEIPHGDDYFCLVAEADGDVVGYLSAGGSRDEDHKSYGEFYELAVDTVRAASAVRRELCTEGLEMMVAAQYGGVLAWVDGADALYAAAVTQLGFAPDDRGAPSDDGARRYEKVLLATRRGR
jgi:hypothetical protein